MEKIEAGAQIGELECPGCGAIVPLKINRAGNAYFFCARVLSKTPEGKSEKCFTRMNWGREASKKMIEQFFATKKEENSDVQNEDRPGQHEQAGRGDTSADVGTVEPVAAQRSLVDSIRRFLTE